LSFFQYCGTGTTLPDARAILTSLPCSSLIHFTFVGPLWQCVLSAMNCCYRSVITPPANSARTRPRHYSKAKLHAARVSFDTVQHHCSAVDRRIVLERNNPFQFILFTDPEPTAYGRKPPKKNSRLPSDFRRCAIKST
jgi:hypothetical protein